MASPPADASEAAAVRHHIDYKTSMRELDPQVAARMLDALAAGAPPDYAALFEAAMFRPLPARCFHTAPVSARASIEQDGIRVSLPSAGTNWGSKATGQVEGVYVGAAPDERGVWAHDDAWDVWEINTTTLPGAAWRHDRLNPGNWVLLAAIPPSVVRLHASHTR